MAYLEAINGVDIHDAGPFLPQGLPELLPHQLHLLPTPQFNHASIVDILKVSGARYGHVTNRLM